FGLAGRLAAADGGAAAGTRRAGIVAVAPLSYLEMLKAMKEAAFVLTDSGGVQEETTALGVPCVTLRDTTERPVTVDQGTNVLAAIGRRAIAEALVAARRKASAARMPALWDGDAGSRIVAALEAAVGARCEAERHRAA